MYSSKGLFDEFTAASIGDTTRRTHGAGKRFFESLSNVYLGALRKNMRRWCHLGSPARKFSLTKATYLVDNSIDTVDSSSAPSIDLPSRSDISADRVLGILDLRPEKMIEFEQKTYLSRIELISSNMK